MALAKHGALSTYRNTLDYVGALSVQNTAVSPGPALACDPARVRREEAFHVNFPCAGPALSFFAIYFSSVSPVAIDVIVQLEASGYSIRTAETPLTALSLCVLYSCVYGGRVSFLLTIPVFLLFFSFVEVYL